jgi:hypothetical protein
MGLLDAFIEQEQCDWLGRHFRVMPLATPLPDEGGIYVLARRSQGLLGMFWDPLYVGKTKCLDDRIDDQHHRMTEAKRLGATHVHFYPCAGIFQAGMERSMVGRLNPPLNVQLCPPTAGLLS